METGVATAEQLKALIRSYSAGDDERFRSITIQIAAQAAREGQQRLADELRKLIDTAAVARALEPGPRSVPIARAGGELAGLVVASYPKVRLSDMVLASEPRARLERVLHEFRHADLLRSHGLDPKRKLLLVGPPGTGKTMTAAALAGELGLPLLLVQLHGLITKFMGETAAKMHLVFDAMARTRGVYFFDEFDAIGARRSKGNDVGEIRRILNSFLQFLEQDRSDSLVLAATNFVRMLDYALFRRFDDVIHYGLPDERMVRELVENRLAIFGQPALDWNKVTAAADGLSQADVVRACEDAAKDALLSGQQSVSTDRLVRSMRRLSRPGKPNKGRRRKRKSG
jgi:SpoVK/Ycf46/Vps4 family AAA+-type ATPase